MTMTAIKDPGNFTRQESGRTGHGDVCELTGLPITGYRKPTSEWTREYSPGGGNSFFLHRLMDDGTRAIIRRIFTGPYEGEGNDAGYWSAQQSMHTDDLTEAMAFAEGYFQLGGFPIPRHIYNEIKDAPVTFTSASYLSFVKPVEESPNTNGMYSGNSARVGVIDIDGYRHHGLTFRTSKHGSWVTGGYFGPKVGDAKHEITWLLRLGAMLNRMLVEAGVQDFEDLEIPGELAIADHRRAPGGGFGFDFEEFNGSFLCEWPALRRTGSRSL